MSKEFHVFTLHETNHEQAIVFEVDRDDEEESIELKDMWLVTSSKYGEIKTRLNMTNIISHIIQTVGGNVAKNNVDTLMDVFKDLISEEKRQEITDSIDNQEKDVFSMTSDSLIIASDIISGIDESELPKMIEKLKKGLD